jgi:hypothetical protein
MNFPRVLNRTDLRKIHHPRRGQWRDDPHDPTYSIIILRFPTILIHQETDREESQEQKS